MIELQMTIGNNATISFKSHLCKYKTAPYQQWCRAFKGNTGMRGGWIWGEGGKLQLAVTWL